MSDVSLFQSSKSIETFGSKDPTWMGPPGVDNIDVSMAPSKPAGRDNNGTPKPPPLWFEMVVVGFEIRELRAHASVCVLPCT